MHRALYLQEILLNIFGHCVPKWLEPARRLLHYNPDVAALARTCRAFKEPALDVLWEDLYDLSPLVRCLPEACRFSDKRYSFRRPLSEVEGNILRGYARRVWSIREFTRDSVDSSAKGVMFTLAPFTGPLFPALRSVSWTDFMTFSVTHVAVPSLTSLGLNFQSFPPDTIPALMEFLDTVGERCPNIQHFQASFPSSTPSHVEISRQLCRWTKLRRVRCFGVTLSIDAILQLSSLTTLAEFSVSLSADLDNYVSRLGSVSIFGSLTDLDIRGSHLRPITSLFSHIQLPVIRELDVNISNYVHKRDVQEFWTTVRRACPSNTLTRLVFYTHAGGAEDPINTGQLERPQVTLNDLLPYKDFSNLRQMSINIPWHVKLTDADLLDLVSTLPSLERISINSGYGWRVDDNDESGITLRGLVQLLRQCPFLGDLILGIDTRTFTQIPLGLDVSFPPRRMELLDFLDSHITRELVPTLASVFTALKLDPRALEANIDGHRIHEENEWPLWIDVADMMVKMCSADT